MLPPCLRFGRLHDVGVHVLHVLNGVFIAGLLGQNGAGKTTTINVLTGLHGIDGGSATVSGLDAGTKQEEIRQIIGVCPQFDKVWADLTVRQHLEFYAVLKGVPKAMVGQSPHPSL